MVTSFINFFKMHTLPIWIMWQFCFDPYTRLTSILNGCWKRHFLVKKYVYFSKMVLKILISRKRMLIFNTIFDPTGKNWVDQIIYSHFKNVCIGKIFLQNMLYIIWVCSLLFCYTYTHFWDQKWCFQHPFTLNSTILVLYKDQDRSVTLFIWVKYAF